MPLTYNQHQTGRDLIDQGADGLGDLMGGALSAELGPLGLLIGKGLGWLVGNAGGEIFDHMPFEASHGILAQNVGLTPINPPAGGIPLAPLNNPSLSPLRPGLSSLTATAPMLSVTPIASKGFNKNNTDLGPAVVVIDDDGKTHTKQVHPSSKRLGNAAMPYNSQGFTARRQR